MGKISIVRRRLEQKAPPLTRAELRSLEREGINPGNGPNGYHYSPADRILNNDTLSFPISNTDATELKQMAHLRSDGSHHLAAILKQQGPILVLHLAPPETEKHLLSCDQVAEMLGMSKSYVYRLAREHRLSPYRIGRMLRFDPDDVLEFLSECLESEEVD